MANTATDIVRSPTTWNSMFRSSSSLNLIPQSSISSNSIIHPLSNAREFYLSHDAMSDEEAEWRNRIRAEKIFSDAKTEYGVACFIVMLRDANQEEFSNFFKNFVISIRLLMMDEFGHILVEKIFERCNATQISEVVDFVCRDRDKLKTICLNVHGSQSMDALIARYNLIANNANSTSVPGSNRILEALRPITIDLTKSHIGYQVIRTCIESFRPEDTQYIACEIAKNCADLAMDHIGCHIVQTCLENKNAYRVYILGYVAHNALMLSQHNYGNYVVQCALRLKNDEATEYIMARLTNNFATLSMNKFGSNVIETCFKACSPVQIAQIIVEHVYDPKFQALLQDRYGNYVAQSALRKSREISVQLLKFLIGAVERHSRSLQGHPFGAKVLSTASRLKQ